MGKHTEKSVCNKDCVAVIFKRMRMTKQELLRQIHEIIWRDDDSMEQDTLSKLQGLVDSAIIDEAKLGTMKIRQLDNGFIQDVEIM